MKITIQEQIKAVAQCRKSLCKELTQTTDEEVKADILKQLDALIETESSLNSLRNLQIELKNILA